MNPAICGRPAVAAILSVLLAVPASVWGQEPAPAAANQKYKLTIVENASTSKRVRKGRVSSQSVVKVTDENDVPVAGIAVTFAIPQLVGGASFANGSLTSIVTTNAAGLASSGSFTATAGSSFSLGVTASVPGGTLTVSIPVSTGAVAGGAGGAAGAAGAGAGSGAGLSTGLIVGIIAGVGAAAAAGIAVGLKGGSSNSNTGGGSSAPTGTIGAAGTPTFGHP